MTTTTLPDDTEPLMLHVLPPALGLPSSDADCLAAILYLQHALPRARWALVGDGWRDFADGHEPPVLRAGPHAHHGLDAITAYLRTIPIARDLDAQLSPRQRADCLAFTALAQTRLPPLHTLQLAALPATTYALPFPHAWTLPSRLRARAHARHPAPDIDLSALGLAAAAGDKHSSEESTSEQEASGWIHVPAALGASAHAHAAQRRDRARKALRDAVDGALGPFEKLLGWDGDGKEGRRFVLGTREPCSVDCVLAAQVALALTRGPGGVVRGAIGEERLGRWEDYVLRVTGRDDWGKEKEEGELPWREARTRGAWEDSVGVAREVGRSAMVGAGWGGAW